MSDERSLTDRLAAHLPAEGSMRTPSAYTVPEQRLRPPDGPRPPVDDTVGVPLRRSSPSDATLVVGPTPTRLADHPRPKPAATAADLEERRGLRAAAVLASATLVIGAGIAGVILLRHEPQAAEIAGGRTGQDAGEAALPLTPLELAPVTPVGPAPTVVPVMPSIVPVFPAASTTTTTRRAAATPKPTTPPPAQPAGPKVTLNPPNRPVPPTRPEYTTSTTAPPPSTTTSTRPAPTTTTTRPGSNSNR